MPLAIGFIDCLDGLRRGDKVNEKLFCILLVSLTLLGFTACKNETIDGGRFKDLPYSGCINGNRIGYCRDKKTDIIYVYRGSGGMSVLYNADGEPMTYDELMEDIEE